MPSSQMSSPVACESGLLTSLIDQMPVGFAVFDRDLRLRHWNAAWTRSIERYTPTPATGVTEGAYWLELAPGTERSLLPLFERALAGEVVRLDGQLMESGGKTSYWDLLLAPLMEDGAITGVTCVLTDATDRILAIQGISERKQALDESQRALERRVEERTRELSTLLRVSHDVASTLEQEPLLGVILDQLRIVVDYDGASILALDDGFLHVIAYRGPIPGDEVREIRFPLEGAGHNREVVAHRRPVIISDVRGDTPLARSFQQTAGSQLDTTFGYIRSWLGVPLVARNTVIGMLSLDHSRADSYGEHQAHLVSAFADQAALAIENTRLREQAEKTAVAAERSRLARDLHDAVTQTLFSASLIAEVLPRLWERNEAEGRRRLEELRQLTRGALAEMRTLLLELRPSALTEASLPDLLRQLAEAVTGRARVPVAVAADGQIPLPADVQIALYRIAQEALNNVAKHSGASMARVALRCRAAPGHAAAGASVDLSIADDGCGFDLASVPADHLGLGIMRERAEAIGATLIIESRPGRGTRVAVTWRGDACIA